MILPALCNLAAATAQPDYLSDHPELILSSTQDWGVLGFDTAAHAPDKEGAPLQISEKIFAKGLGHHANGIITLMADGQYESFDAEVGIQPCNSGSVIFRVFVDGQQRFDSGVLRSGAAPKPVHVSLVSAQEVRRKRSGLSCLKHDEKHIASSVAAIRHAQVPVARRRSGCAWFVRWPALRFVRRIPHPIACPAVG